MNEEMKSVQIKVKHVVRVVIILIITAIIILYGVPSFRRTKFRSMPKLEIEAIYKQIKEGDRKVYQSEGSLRFKKRKFYLDGKPLRIFSGAFHYFRVLPQYWNETFLKMKASGLNTVETYVAWNMHEENRGQYNFKGNNGLLDVREFIQTAKAHGFYVILRPGPYICAEWEFGGLPSWLLKDGDMKVRSNYKGYVDAVDRYFSKLFPYIKDLQYAKGGPIIAFQIENEYASYSTEVEHIKTLKKMMKQYGVVEMFFTSDGGNLRNWKRGLHPIVYEALPTVNFKDLEDGGQELVDFVLGLSEEFPLFIMEYWTGWFEEWGNKHSSDMPTPKMIEIVTNLLDKGASINFYMFRGGTNFGFMNGAKHYQNDDYKPVITSYDYMSPLSEAGDVTEKYHVIRDLLLKYQDDVHHFHGAMLKEIPPNTEKAAYGTVPIQSYLSFEDMVTEVTDKIQSEDILSMEHLPLQQGSGQNYGYILYRKVLPKIKKINIKGLMHDRAQVFWNGKEVATFDWTETWYVLHMDMVGLVRMDKAHNTLDILVENQGRLNSAGTGFYNQEYKGIFGELFVDGSNESVKKWEIYPLDFRPQYLNKIWINHKYKAMPNRDVSPAIFSAEFHIEGKIKDTFLSMEGWTKGVVFINSFNLGRYWKQGPQQTLYVPGSILKNKKINTIRIFEQKKAGKEVIFLAKPNLGDHQ